MWPNDSRFNCENFGYQPTTLILDALNNGQKIRWEKLHYSSLPTSQVAQTVAVANQIKINSRAAEPKDFQPFYQIVQEMSGDRYPKAACSAVESLIADPRAPLWMERSIPLDEIRKQVDKNYPAPTPRLWANGISLVALIAPKKVGDRIGCAMACIPKGLTNRQVPIYDFDSGAKIACIQVYGSGDDCIRYAPEGELVMFDIVEVPGFD